MPTLDTLAKPVKYNLIIIDGKNMCYKYRYGMSNLKNRSGVHTGLYHGFLMLILRLSNMYPKADVIVAWEGGELVRKKQLASYKNGRAKLNESFKKQILHLKQMLGQLGVSQKYSPGYEADDVAATLAKSSDGPVLLVTEDSDWCQCLKESDGFWRSNKIIPYNQVKSNLGFPPEKYALYTVLKGKGSNNVKGLYRFPNKFAKELATLCKSINDLCDYKSTDSKYLKWEQVIQENKLELQQLYDVVRAVDSVNVEDLPCQKKNLNQLKKNLIKLELFQVLSLLKKLRRVKKSG